MNSDGWVAHDLNKRYPADREITLRNLGTVRPLTALRCRGCGRYVAWFYPDPWEGGLLLLRREPLKGVWDGIFDDALQRAMKSPGNNKPDCDGNFRIANSETDSGDPGVAYCAECRAWRNFRLSDVRTAIANKKTTIRC